MDQPRRTLQDVMALPEEEREAALADYARQMAADGLTEEMLLEMQALVDQISATIRRGEN